MLSKFPSLVVFLAVNFRKIFKNRNVKVSGTVLYFAINPNSTEENFQNKKNNKMTLFLGLIGFAKFGQLNYF